MYSDVILGHALKNKKEPAEVLDQISRLDFEKVVQKIVFEYDNSGESWMLLRMVQDKDLTQLQIAESLGKSERTIRRHIVRLFQHIQQKLSEMNINIDFLER